MQRLISLYTATYGCTPDTVDRLTQAGSNRSYFRVSCAGKDSVIGCVGTSVEENTTFIYMARHFASLSLPVPRIISVNDDMTAYLQDDLGDHSLFDLISSGRNAGGDYNEEEVSLLKKTIRMLPRMQFVGAQRFDFTRCFQCQEMDSTTVMFDLNYFKYCFLKLKDIAFDEYMLESDFRKLTEKLLTPHPSLINVTTLLYRDFQARNVMICYGEPYVIDFQGGRRGPIFYDVASFLWQASSRFSETLRMQLIDDYLDALRDYVDMPREEFISILKTFVLFRTLQVLGAYGYRGLWEKKKHFIASIQPAIDNLVQLVNEGVCNDYPELRNVALRLSADASINDTAVTQNQAQSFLQNDATYLAVNPAKPLVVRVFSFSFKKGIPADESGNGGGYVFDCRASHNPGRYEPYKQLTGLDRSVIEFLESDGEILRQLDSMLRLVDFHVARYKERGFTDLMISCGCTGGRHRSVYCAEHIAEHIYEKFGIEVRLCHREQNIQRVLI